MIIAVIAAVATTGAVVVVIVVVEEELHAYLVSNGIVGKLSKQYTSIIITILLLLEPVNIDTEC